MIGKETIVRAYKLDYHINIFDKFNNEELKYDPLYNNSIEAFCPGGGRIYFSDKLILVYGYSTRYGKADHSKTVEIILKSADYKGFKMEWSDNLGY